MDEMQKIQMDKTTEDIKKFLIGLITEDDWIQIRENTKKCPPPA